MRYVRTNLALKCGRAAEESGGDRFVAQYTRQNFTTEQALGILEEIALFETDMGRQQVGETEKHFAIGNLEFAHEALHGTMFNQGARNDGAGAHCLQTRQEVDFLFAEMRQQFCVEGLAGMCAGLDDRLIVAALRRTAPVHGKAQGGVVLAGKILQFRAAFHGTQCCPRRNISL